jgi:hypothetical protein
MSSEASIVEAIRAAFANTPRPTHFTNASHCEECAEHDSTLLAHTPDTITLEQVGNPGWDPICYVDTQGYHYYMPGLVRLALGRGSEFYLGQFLSHLSPSRIEAFNPDQRLAMLAFLEYERDTMLQEIEDNSELKALDRRIRRLKG